MNCKLGLGKKFVLALVVLIIIPMLIGLFTIYKNIGRQVQAMENETVLNKDQVVKELIKLYEDNIRSSLTTNANWTDFQVAIQKDDKAWIEENVLSITQIQKKISFIVVTDLAGQVVAQKSAPHELQSDISSSNLFQMMAQGNKVYTGLYNTGSGLAMVSVGKVLNNDGAGEPTGVLIFGSLLTKENLDSIKQMAKCDLTLYSEAGAVSTAPEVGQVTKLKGYFDRLKSANTVTVEKREAQQKIIFDSYAMLKDIDDQPAVLLQVASSSAASLVTTNTLKKYIGGFFIGALIVVILLYWWQKKNQINPIVNMAAAVKQCSEGNFQVNVAVHSKDELGELAGSVNQMVANLKGLIGGIVEASQRLAAQSQELAASSEQVSATTEEATSATDQVAAVSDLSATNAVATAQASQQVLNLAEQGNQAVVNTLNKINAIAEDTKEAEADIKGLGQLSLEIGKITDVITGIADQTNLLALNAAIEAARAGEHGRGFAVVAEEVRKLAEQSAGAAKEIGQLIKEIQTKVDKSVRTMSKDSDEVAEGVQLAAEAGQALTNIVESNRKMAQLVGEIVSSAQQASEGTKQLATANEQISSTIQQVTAAAQELANLAEELQNSVAEFQI